MRFAKNGLIDRIYRIKQDLKKKQILLIPSKKNEVIFGTDCVKKSIDLTTPYMLK